MDPNVSDPNERPLQCRTQMLVTIHGEFMGKLRLMIVLTKNIFAYDKTLDSLNIKIDGLPSVIKSQLGFKNNA
jgi:hypothetical protein